MPRPTGSAPWPRLSATRPNSRPQGQAYRRTTLAAAEAQAIRVQADGTAYAERTTAEAQAAANNARADSLKGGNQELIAANRIVENVPALDDTAAPSIASSKLTILNGTEGVNQIATGIVGQGLAILDTLKHSSTDAGRTAPRPSNPPTDAT